MFGGRSWVCLSLTFKVCAPCLVESCLPSLNQSPRICSTAVAIARSFAEGLRSHSDTFAVVQVHAVMVRALLTHIDCGQEVRKAISVQLDAAFTEATAALNELEHEFDGHKYCLLSLRGGYTDLYYLPLRLSQVLGWVGFLLCSQQGSWRFIGDCTAEASNTQIA